MKKVLLFVLLGLMTACGASSETAKGNAEIDGEQAKAAFEKAFPAVEVSDVRAAPMAGMLELEVNGGETVYMSEDGRFIIVVYEEMGEDTVYPVAAYDVPER